MTSSLVTVVVPLFDGAPFIVEAIHSVLDQGHRPIEVIVVDDGSTDGGGALADRFGDPVRCVRHDRSGPGAARNLGISLASGDFLGFLDADDLYVAGRVDRQLAELVDDTSLDVVYGAVSEFLSPELSSGASLSMRPPVRASAMRSPGTMLIRRSAFQRVGRFAENLRRSETLDWFLRADERGLASKHTDDVVLLRRLHGSNNGMREIGQLPEYARVLKAALNRRRSQLAPGEERTTLT